MNLHRSTGRWRLGLALALLTSLLWGLLPIGLKILLNVMDPYTVTWSRFLIAGGLLAAMGVYRYRPPSWSDLDRGYLLLLLIAVVGLSGNYLIYLLGLDFISPSTAQIVIQLAPIFMLLGSLLFFGERFTVRQWLGFGILLIGLTLYFNDRFAELLYGLRELTSGVLLILISAVLWAAYGLAQKQLLRALHPTFILLVIYLGGSLLLLPLANPTQFFRQDALTLSLLVACALATLIGYRSFAGALQHIEASRVSMILALTPLVTVAGVALVAPLFPDLIRPDRLNPFSLFGAFLVVSGSMLTALGRTKAR